MVRMGRSSAGGHAQVAQASEDAGTETFPVVSQMGRERVDNHP